MIKVRFNSVAEFKQEALNERPCILRLTKSFTQSPSYPITSVSVIATFLTQHENPMIVKLERFCGQDYPIMNRDDSAPANEKATKIVEELEQFANDIGAQVRAGIYED